MVNKPKQAGTAAETAVVNWLQVNGHPWAERRSLKGGLDQGDVTGIPGICIEIKAGRTLALSGWLKETAVETVNAKADYGVLVVKPVGYGNRRVDQWWAVMYYVDWERLWNATGQQGVIIEVSGAKHIVSEVGRVLAAGHIAVVKAKGAGQREAYYVVMTLSRMNDWLTRAGYGDQPLIERVTQAEWEDKNA